MMDSISNDGRHFRRSLLRAALLLTTSALIAVTPANAQSTSVADQANEGDIIVTARKRDEALLKVPVSVSALNARAIIRYSASDLNRIADNIPAVQITRQSTGNGGLIAIRGIYSSATDPGLEAAVSVSIDGFQLSRGYITQAAFFDLQQVEVLKGPQALFFGKNSPAGVISLKSMGPGDTFSGYARAGYEFRANERYLEGAVGGPVTETLGARIAFRVSKMDGWLHNVAGPIANPIEPTLPLPGATNNKTTPAARSIAGRATLEWKPTTDFTARLKMLYSDYRDNELTGQQQVVSCNGRPNSTTSGAVDPFGDCIPNNKRSSGSLNPLVAATYPLTDGEYYSENKSLLASLTLGYTMGDLSINSHSGIYDLKARGLGNSAGAVFPIFPGVNGENSRIYTQELRLTSAFDAPVNFMIGAFYEHSKRESYTIGRGGFVFPVPFDPNFGGASVAYFNDDFVRSNTYSAFGQLMWDITDNLQASGGVRYTREVKKAALQNLYVNPLQPSAVAALRPPGSVLPGRFEDSNWSPEATLNWQPSPNQTAYISYKTGYKSGGFSTTAVLLRSNTIAGLTFGSETAKGGEIGYKAEFLNRALTFTSAIFHYSFNGLQRSALNIATTSFQVRNAATARTKGIEAELSYRLSSALSVRGSGTWNKAYFVNFATAPCYNGQPPSEGCIASSQDISGQTIALAPRFSATGGFSFDTPVTNGLGLGLTGDIRYVSRYRTQDDNTPGAIQDGYFKFNASARVYDDDDKWDVSLIGINLFNKYAILSTTSKPGGRSGDIWGVVERGREVRVQASVRF